MDMLTRCLSGPDTGETPRHRSGLETWCEQVFRSSLLTMVIGLTLLCEAAAGLALMSLH